MSSATISRHGEAYQGRPDNRDTDQDPDSAFIVRGLMSRAFDRSLDVSRVEREPRNGTRTPEVHSNRADVSGNRVRRKLPAFQLHGYARNTSYMHATAPECLKSITSVVRSLLEIKFSLACAVTSLIVTSIASYALHSLCRVKHEDYHSRWPPPLYRWPCPWPGYVVSPRRVP